MKILLVDDEPAALERLDAFLKQIPDVAVLGAARNGREALNAIEAGQPDLVLLDIQMPELNGLSVAAQLPAGRRPEIVFVTAFEMYAPDAFEVDAADYLLKPVRFDRLRQAIERARRRRAAQSCHPAASASPSQDAQGFWVQTRSRHVRVRVEDIDWIEAAKDYVLLHTPTRSHMHRITMSGLEQVLDPSALIRVHRSAFVAPSRVQEVQRVGRGLVALVLNDGAIVQVGPTYLRAVLARLGLSEPD